MKAPPRKALILIGLGATVLVGGYILWKKHHAGSSSEEGILSAGGVPAGQGGETASERNEARESRQNQEKLGGELVHAEIAELAGERSEGRESRAQTERENNAERQAKREEGQEERHQILAERQQQFEHEHPPAPPGVPGASPAAKAAGKHPVNKRHTDAKAHAKPAKPRHTTTHAHGHSVAAHHHGAQHPNHPAAKRSSPAHYTPPKKVVATHTPKHRSTAHTAQHAIRQQHVTKPARPAKRAPHKPTHAHRR